MLSCIVTCLHSDRIKYGLKQGVSLVPSKRQHLPATAPQQGRRSPTIDRPPPGGPVAGRTLQTARPKWPAQGIRSIFDPLEEAEMEQEPFTLVQGKRRRPRKSSLSDSSSDNESIQIRKWRVSARDLDLLLTSDNRVIIAGDLNSKSEMWDCRKTNTLGRILYQHSLNNDYVILAPKTPTHLSNGGLSDILDIALIKGINLNATLEVVNDLNSDHLPVIMNLEGRVTNTTPVKTLNYSKANWIEFREHLDVLLPECSGPWKGIDNALWELTKSIQHAVNMAVPPRTEPKFYQRIPDFIHRLIKDRNRLWRYNSDSVATFSGRQTPDPDPIPNLVLKQLSRKALIYLTNIFNSSLAVEYFPVEWKKANIIVFAIPGWKPIKAGVPQGSLLGPTLFNLYVNDLPASPGTKVAMYADDTAFLAQSWKPSLVSNRLQGALDKAESWFSRWRMRVNP
ncbi:hypothetical protein AAG570_009728 [Ranatra chinensis]|uniref:Reverse transcriptase n=1 Tax=Ranatra chinensis TaxID=642074 RepID=A0ABD0YPX2_9HEMI